MQQSINIGPGTVVNIGPSEQVKCEPCIIQSAFRFTNGNCIIIYATRTHGIKTFLCDDKFNPIFLYAECPMDWAEGTPKEYHERIRKMHLETDPDSLVLEHSTDLNF